MTAIRMPAVLHPVFRTGWCATFALLILAACSDDKQPSVGPSGDTPSINDVFPEPFREIWAPFNGDLPGMIDRRVVRVVTAFGGHLYFFEDGAPRGATLELTNRLETYLNKELGKRNIKVYIVVIPLSRDQLIPALLAGHADIIAADLTVTERRSKQLAFTRPLRTDVNEVIVTGPAADAIESLDDLAGKRVHVRRSSSYFEHLKRLSLTLRERDLSPVHIQPVDELLESEDILEMTDAGMVDMTVMNNYEAESWTDVFSDIQVRADLIVNSGGDIAWAVRKQSPQLLDTLNTFLGKFGRGTLVGNDIFNRYLRDANELRCAGAMLNSERLQELAPTFMQYGEMYDFEWLMLAAQAFQESKLRQQVRSPAGAVGVMQIRPATAADPNVGVDDIATVDGNVHAGAKYMRFLADRYFADASIDDLNRWLLSLAAYNAGPARVINLRNAARRNGYDPDKWFDNVEIVAARQVGRETLSYVSNVFKYYASYHMAHAKVTASQRRFGDLLSACQTE